MVPYSFQFSAFQNGAVAPSKLESEIRASSIAVAVAYTSTAEGVCTVHFKAALSSSEEQTLAAIVAAHDGVEPAPTTMPVEVYSAGNSAPAASDGKPFVLPNIFPGDVILVFAGASDSETARCGGPLFELQRVGRGSESFTIEMRDGVFLAGGHVSWEGGSIGSFIELCLNAPASTTKAPASPGTGNCNRVPTQFGFDAIIPAAGNGQYDIDKAVPVPVSDDESSAPTGFWSHSEPWCGLGQVAPGVPGNAKYALFAAPLKMATFAKIPLTKSSGSRDFLVSSIKPKWILPEWQMKVELFNANAQNTLTASWDLTMARRRSA